MKPLVLMSSLELGGAERVTVSFLRRLGERARGPAATLCTVSPRENGGLAQELADAGVARADLAARRLAAPRALGRYLALLSRGRFDLVHAHGQDASILAAAAKPFHRAPLVLTRHVLEEPTSDWRQKLRARAALLAARHANARIAVSRAAASHLSRTARIPEERISIIGNGIEVERFDAVALRRDRDRLREAIGIHADEPMVLLPAALREGKGHEVALAALPFLKARVPRARLVLAGGGALEREALLRDIAQPFGRAVVFLGWREDMPALLAAADVVVLPSYREAFPTVLLEAAAASKPVVATDLPGVREIVREGETGCLVPPGDVEALGEAVARVLLEPDVSRAMGERARRLAEREFSLDRQVERTCELWTSVLAGRRS